MTGGTPPNKRSLDRAQRNPGNGREACTPEPGFRFQAGSHFGLTPKKYQSGETDYSGRISKIGDASVREALYEAAHIILTKPIKGCSRTILPPASTTQTLDHSNDTSSPA
jgi:transposase IS116/IS110/IS902 family protein